jgi:hypothetical protein
MYCFQCTIRLYMLSKLISEFNAICRQRSRKGTSELQITPREGESVNLIIWHHNCYKISAVLFISRKAYILSKS